MLEHSRMAQEKCQKKELFQSIVRWQSKLLETNRKVKFGWIRFQEVAFFLEIPRPGYTEDSKTRQQCPCFKNPNQLEWVILVANGNNLKANQSNSSRLLHNNNTTQLQPTIGNEYRYLIAHQLGRTHIFNRCRHAVKNVNGSYGHFLWSIHTG